MKEINYDNYYWQNEYIRLRAVEPDDWEVHYYNRFDTPARRLLDYEVELPPTINEVRNSVETFMDFKSGTGRIMFTITFSIGMQIDRDHRGKGYGTAAMRLVLRYAFFERRLNKYYGAVLEGNIASSTVLKKLGCVQEGIRRQMVYTDGRYLDEIQFSLTKYEFIENEKVSR